jgi:hypothetical protein
MRVFQPKQDRASQLTHSTSFLRAPSRSIQAKLAINVPDDACEQEADRVSEQVMSMPERRNAAVPVNAVGADAGQMAAPPIVHEVLSSPGQPLDSATRAFMEPKFRFDFSKVRVHSDGEAEKSARAVNALAYTVGHDIVFGSAQYAPSSSAGRRLLSHELTHVAQQASVSASQILRRDSPAPAVGGESSLEDILPPKVGLVATIDRQVVLRNIFGEQGLSQLVKEVKANPLALAFTRRTGILGLLALVDTRGAKGLDPAKAEATLKADKQHHRYQRELLEPRNDAPKSFWFQKNPPAQTGQQGPQDIPSATSHLSDVVQDPQNPIPIPAPISGGKPVGPAISVNFAFLGSDLIGGRPSTELRQGKERVVDAIKKVSGDIGSLPPAPSAAARTQDEQVRARLREAVRGFSDAKPLNIFLASGEEQALIDPSPWTEAIFVRQEDIGDDKKLEAAIRLPLVAFLGGSSGPLTTSLTANEAGETLLHEMVHDLLLRRGLSANDLWEKIRAKVAQGPPTVKNRCEEMVHRFLLAQEEVFVYDNVSKLGPEYSSLAGINQPRYELWSLEAEAFFKQKGVTLTKTTNKLAVSDKVAGKKVDWTIDYEIPDPMTVTGADLTPVNQVVQDFPSRG